MSTENMDLISKPTTNILVVENRMGSAPLYIHIDEYHSINFFKHEEKKYIMVVQISHLFECYTRPTIFYENNGHICIEHFNSTSKVRMLNGEYPEEFISRLCDLDIFKEDNAVIFKQLSKIQME